MRKILVFAVFVFAVFCVVPVHAQFKFGLKAGVEFSDLSVDDAFESTNGMGFFIGPTVKVKLPLGGLGVDASVLYADGYSGIASVTTDILTDIMKNGGTLQSRVEPLINTFENFVQNTFR